VSLDPEVQDHLAERSNFLDGSHESIHGHETLDHMDLAIVSVHEASPVGIGIPHNLKLLTG
jgi:hypothetical protein